LASSYCHPRRGVRGWWLSQIGWEVAERGDGMLEYCASPQPPLADCRAPASFLVARWRVESPPSREQGRRHPFLETHVVVRIVQYGFPSRRMLCLPTRRKVIPETRRETERCGTRLGSLRENTMLSGAANCSPPAPASLVPKANAEYGDADCELPTLPSSLSRSSSSRCFEWEAGRGTLYLCTVRF
jgi:hypothetical protein